MGRIAALDLSPLVAAVALFAASTAIGMANVVKIITIYEAKHELKQGSAGWIRSISGWTLVVFWLLITWFLATIIGDWHVSGDLEGALDRSWLRLQIVLEIMAALGSD
ncbi:MULTISPECIES: hypothetical protein [Marivita]|uniref:Uncharacterized protein n=1 Tax=Marivita cryptomonadis TaxID=505252 RepID=A0ABS1ZUG5_9RHOB|nr:MULTISPECIES: hypothetical protein [Marivita]MBM2321493.1 hypothetical protein [Marivita cryptomonadis]MBM2331074.1 hypothetical protein [Marivita cryptomonadis]MBM2340660.1 hypothetical protein [Marivita cryptomonadis]MBM2345322.1 hypothetical protein [Marivita cryptomonadis]MBM2350000.1 hypothetical protein [Marivita cryptomonadis]